MGLLLLYFQVKLPGAQLEAIVRFPRSSSQSRAISAAVVYAVDNIEKRNPEHSTLTPGKPQETPKYSMRFPFYVHREPSSLRIASCVENAIDTKASLTGNAEYLTQPSTFFDFPASSVQRRTVHELCSVFSHNMAFCSAGPTRTGACGSSVPRTNIYCLLRRTLPVEACTGEQSFPKEGFRRGSGERVARGRAAWIARGSYGEGHVAFSTSEDAAAITTRSTRTSWRFPGRGVRR